MTYLETSYVFRFQGRGRLCVSAALVTVLHELAHMWFE